MKLDALMTTSILVQPPVSLTTTWRIIYGDKIPIEKSSLEHPNFAQVTGSIGYLDFEKEKRLLKETFGTTLIVENMGIEQGYTRQGYALKLLDYVEKIARKEGLPALYTSNVTPDGRELFSALNWEDIGSDYFRKLLN